VATRGGRGSPSFWWAAAVVRVRSGS
jgi:hypothetical protein